MDVYFCSFADSRMSASLQRIKKQALSFNMFKDIYVFDEKDLDFSFKQLNKDKLILGSRGYGYWIWKPYIIQRVLTKLSDGDILVYADAGCHLNIRGKERFSIYFDLLIKNELGLLVFEQIGLLEKHWTKGDIFDFFNVRDNESITDSYQRAGGIFLIRKNKKIEDVFTLWNHICGEKFFLIDDSPSFSPNFEGFIENRHDQSIISIISKLYNAAVLPSSEIYASDWNTMYNYPIWAKRDKKLKWNYLMLRKLQTACRIIKKLLYT